MSLELLPNEILLDVFDYLNGIDLLRTFYGLTSRFNILLHERFQNCSIELNSVSKRDFDRICQQHLPAMSDYIVALNISDSEETPAQIKQFLQYVPSFNGFTRLQSLSLFNLRSYHTLRKIIEQCYNLGNLTHLNFFSCYLQESQVDFQLIVNHIWSLSKLIYCSFGIGIKGQCLFGIPTKISLSLEYLSIDKNQLKLNQIDRLIEHTPNLKCLSISVPSFVDNHYVSSPLPNLVDLNINSLFPCNASKMDILLKNTPNLRRLTVLLSSELIHGNLWEEIIRKYLPMLQFFRLKMKVMLPLGQHMQERADDLINSFQSSFWIDEHQWFVRCLTWNRTIYVYTVPNQYEDNLPVSFRSTYPFDSQQDFYQSITQIISPTLFDQPIPSGICLPKINYLCINLPINDSFWSIAPILNQLKSLKILMHTNAFQSQVQELLNRAPHLIKLSINQYESISLQTALFKYTNLSVCELDLRNINHHFNEEDCIRLSRSPLGVQCETLSILVHNRDSIISLVENMHKLRALNVRCRDETYVESTVSMEESSAEYYNDDEENKDDCILWLKTRLSSTCVIVRDPKLTCNLLIWI
ncbi:unnamed protein product [Rotaria socialis]